MHLTTNYQIKRFMLVFLSNYKIQNINRINRFLFFLNQGFGRSNCKEFVKETNKIFLLLNGIFFPLTHLNLRFNESGNRKYVQLIS